MPAGSAPLIIIAGPTASGKSTLAMKLAKSLDGEILAADSVQVYQGFDIGSAKASVAERGEIKHHLLDYCDARSAFNAGEFVAAADATIADIQKRGKSAIICGGTTMYLTALLHGLVDAPKQDADLRQRLEKLSNDELVLELSKIDSKSAQRIHANDRVRLVRAVETGLCGAAPLSELHEAHRFAASRYRALIVVLCWNREDLYSRINRRVKDMLDSGLIEEAKSLLEKYPRSCPAFNTLGYAQALSFIDGELAEAEVFEEISMQTRRYAKRQMTYWRNEPAKRGWEIEPQGQAGEVLLEKQGSAARSKRLKEFRVLKFDYVGFIQRLGQGLGDLGQAVKLWYVDAQALLEL